MVKQNRWRLRKSISSRQTTTNLTCCRRDAYRPCHKRSAFTTSYRCRSLFATKLASWGNPMIFRKYLAKAPSVRFVSAFISSPRNKELSSLSKRLPSHVPKSSCFLLRSKICGNLSILIYCKFTSHSKMISIFTSLQNYAKAESYSMKLNEEVDSLREMQLR